MHIHTYPISPYRDPFVVDRPKVLNVLTRMHCENVLVKLFIRPVIFYGDYVKNIALFEGLTDLVQAVGTLQVRHKPSGEYFMRRVVKEGARVPVDSHDGRSSALVHPRMSILSG